MCRLQTEFFLLMLKTEEQRLRVIKKRVLRGKFGGSNCKLEKITWREVSQSVLISKFNDTPERNCHFPATVWNCMTHRQALQGFPDTSQVSPPPPKKKQ
jgi:hypothetical protein